MPKRLTPTRWLRAIAVASALTALSSAVAVAAPDHYTAPQGRATYEFVPASSLPAKELRNLNQPMPLAEYMRQHHAATAQPSQARTANDDPDLRGECAKHATAAKSAEGWIKSRWESCVKHPYDLVLKNKDNGEDIGRLWFDMWILGFAYDGQRRVDYASSVENIVVQTAPGEDATKWVIGQQFSKTIFSHDDPGATVNEPQKSNREETLGGWHNTPLWTLTYTAPDNGPQFSKGDLQRVDTMVGMELHVDSPNASNAYNEIDAYKSYVRYDYAGPTAGKAKGTVFDNARVELVMSLKDREVKESARHIWDAQHNPKMTFPSWLGKSVPGGDDEPLHRLVDRAAQEENRNKAIAVCNTVWGDYSGSGLECDEYPFASTKEGANAGDNRFSARLISKDDNRKGGERINALYTMNRMLDGDPFYVKITP